MMSLNFKFSVLKIYFLVIQYIEVHILYKKFLLMDTFQIIILELSCVLFYTFIYISDCQSHLCKKKWIKERKKERKHRAPTCNCREECIFQRAEGISEARLKYSDSEPLAFSCLNLMLHAGMANIANLIGSKGRDDAFGFPICKVLTLKGESK